MLFPLQSSFETAAVEEKKNWRARGGAILRDISLDIQQYTAVLLLTTKLLLWILSTFINLFVVALLLLTAVLLA